MTPEEAAQHNRTAPHTAQAEIDRLRSIVDEVHAWAVCAPICTDSDMMGNIERIIEITSPPNAPDQRPEGSA